MNEQSVYFPQVFSPDDLEHAKDIILSSDANGKKWLHETEFTVESIVRAFEEAGAPIREDHVLLDYGCGVGRLAKAVIERTGCTVIGVDISAGMLRLASEYVNSPRFLGCSQSAWMGLVRAGLRCDGAWSVWTLQHCLRPDQDIQRIRDGLKGRSPFYVVNMAARYVPILQNGRVPVFAEDGLDVRGDLLKQFELCRDLPFLSDSSDAYCVLLKSFATN